jgi:WhiB family transcriptional regulator, redox-sensing transcriptional regulator
MIWQDYAACAGMDVNLFFPSEGEKEDDRKTASARSACAVCPVRMQCLDFAIRLNCAGFYGGMTERQRKDYVSG